MGTKNNPEPIYDCLAQAKPDEPYFVLLGRDPMAGLLVRLWADMREKRGEDPDKVANARKIADEMDAWAKSLDKTPIRSIAAELERIERIENDEQEPA
jgi:hypothetical protein